MNEICFLQLSLTIYYRNICRILVIYIRDSSTSNPISLLTLVVFRFCWSILYYQESQQKWRCAVYTHVALATGFPPLASFFSPFCSFTLSFGLVPTMCPIRLGSLGWTAGNQYNKAQSNRRCCHVSIRHPKLRNSLTHWCNFSVWLQTKLILTAWRLGQSQKNEELKDDETPLIHRSTFNSRDCRNNGSLAILLLSGILCGT